MSMLSTYERIDPSYLVEEETLSSYNPKHYYPVQLGEVLHERYRVIGKLGFGSSSTVWLCKDLQNEHDYVAIKVYINSSKYHRELPIYEETNNLRTAHEGRKYVRPLYDSFELGGPHGTHICLVHRPLGISLGELKEIALNGLFDSELIRQTLRCILTGLQFLHNEARIIHTDLQPSNMLLGIHDDSVLAKFEQYENQNPCPRKEVDGRTIYLSRPMPLTKGEPFISDLGEARFGDTKHTDRVMPNVYRAPEVILGVPWSYPVDVWGFGMVLWDLFQPNRLFQARGSNGKYSEAQHLAEMIAIMGPPPVDFLQQCGEKAEQYWDKDGQYRTTNFFVLCGNSYISNITKQALGKNLAPIPETSLERMDERLEGEENQEFVAFMRKMLQWDPNDRQDSESVYWDEWFLADLIESGEVVRDG